MCHEWNTVSHVIAAEARPAVRPLTREELQRFFDHADERVEVARRLGRKGWFAAWRDATLFKLVYAFGLRRREAAMLDVTDFGPNPKAAEFGRFGVLQVRYGKAMRGSPPQRRSVLAVMPWSTTVLTEYVEQVRPGYVGSAGPTLWPTERGGRVAADYISRRFAAYRDALGLDTALHPHCLRHSTVISGASGGVRDVGFRAGALRALLISDSCRHVQLRSAHGWIEHSFVSSRARLIKDQNR